MVQRGEADVARWVSQEQCKSAPQCKGGPTVETILLRPDTMNPVLADKRIREAIALAIDKDAIMNDILGGGEPAAMLVRPTVFGFNPALKPYPYDPARAKQLVAEAKAAGVPVDTTPLTLIVRRAAYFRIEEAAEAITDMLQTGRPDHHQAPGAGDRQVHRALQRRAQADRARARHHGGQQPRQRAAGLRPDGAASTTSARADSRPTATPTLDEMQNKALPLTGAERVKAYQAIGQYVHDDFVAVPIGAPSFWYAISQRLDWTPRTDGFILGKEMKLKP